MSAFIRCMKFGGLLHDLAEHIRLIPTAVVRNQSGYDGELTAVLGMQPATSRYRDATWKGQKLEYKKGGASGSTACEQALISNPAAADDVLTLFFVPHNARGGTACGAAPRPGNVRSGDRGGFRGAFGGDAPGPPPPLSKPSGPGARRRPG